MVQPVHNSPDGSGPHPPAREARKAGFAAFVGTTIEYFDFYIYGAASALVFGEVFFSGAPPAIGTLAAFATFWVGFLARPLGGLIFGHLGDRVSRKTALITTLTMMGLGTVGVGLLPGYAQLGALAPIVLIILRMVQGVAVGGEWGGAVSIATEFAPARKKILYGAFAQQGSPVGNLLATVAFLVIASLPEPDFMSWAWRLPFLFSAVLVVVGLVVRLRLAETPEMRQLLDDKRVTRLPIKEVLTKHSRLVALGVGAGVAGVSITYVKTTFALSWATTALGYDKSAFLTVITIALVVQVLVQPFGAVLASRINLRKAILYMLLPELVLLPAMFLLIKTGSLTLAAIGMAAATFPHAMYYAALAGILSQVFPAAVRYTGMSLCYQLCTTLFAGTAPIVAQALLTWTGSIWPVVGVGLGYVLLTVVCVFALIRHSSWRDRVTPATSERVATSRPA